MQNIDTNSILDNDTDRIQILTQNEVQAIAKTNTKEKKLERK